ncbi:MAG: FAD-dependent thymidylate synthase [Gammaproteobacteria bacterium]|nr:FAD-dependent thymidylate synthase [Gammaproteobacteria bacterium]MYF62561.1 FAD-dependent thymidylate synthase [Gammaproteobacteria bacterium]
METRRPTTPEAEEILGLYYPVLDHGFVSLVDYMGTDESIEHAARVSYGYGTRRRSATRGLIRYLRRHLHTTPSEMVELKFHCAMPMFVARQWVRHRTACLAEGTEVFFDLPGAEARGRRQLYKLPIEEIWRRFQPTRNRTRPDKQRNPFFRRDRVRRMKLRQVNEDTLAFQHTRIVDVYRNGPKPVFRMVLEDGKSIEATSDHRFLFADGWNTLGAASRLREIGGRAVWQPGDYFVYVNGAAEERPAFYRDPIWLQREYRGSGSLAIASRLDKAKLVRIKHFEFVGERETYDLEVKGPYHNFVANGVVTHNSINEYSGRYSLMPLLFYSPDRENFSLQSTSNNQGREEDAAPKGLYRDAIRQWEDVRKSASQAYGWMVEQDIARELARIDLPLSTYTQWYWKIDLHNLLHFLTLRVDDHAQWEIQEFGRVMAGMLKRVAPMSFEAWVDYQVCGDKLSRMELEALATLVAPGEDGGLEVREGGGALSFEELRGMGMAPREVRELVGKIRRRTAPDFDLDLSRFRSAEDVAAEMHEAVPEGSFE